VTRPLPVASARIHHGHPFCPATPRAQVKADAEAKAGRSFGTYDVVSFSTQVVAGTNYMLKVYAGGPLFPLLMHHFR
jgi:hypothetical protein